MLFTIGATYAELGQLEPAEELLRKSLAIGSDDELVLAARRSQLAFVLIQRGQHAEAAALLAQALAELEQSGTNVAAEHVSALEREAELLIATNRLAEAEQSLVRAHALAQASGSEFELAKVLTTLGDLSYGRRDFARAEELHRGALELALRLYPDAHPRIAATRNSLASDLFDQGQIDPAEEQWTQALEIFERVLDPAHPDLAAVVGNLALVYARRRDFERAEPMFERALELRRAALGPVHPRVSATLSRYSDMLLAKGDLERAEQTAREAIDVRRRAGETDAGLAKDLFSLAIVLRQRQRAGEAVPLMEEALRLQRQLLEGEHPDLAQTLTLLGSVRLDLGETREAEPLLRDALAIRRAKLPGNWLTANTASVLGGCLVALERFDEAEALLVESLPAIEAALGPRDFRSRDARERLAELDERTARAELALSLRERGE
jgi:tetratricopeptide (TPR) repeat protein